jgi:outer membrane protein
MINKRNHLRLIGICFYILASSAIAAPAPIITSTLDKTKEDSRIGIGLTTSIAKRPFVGVDEQNASLLYLSYQYKRFYIEGLDLGFNLYKNKYFTIDMLGTPRFYEVEPAFASNNELNGIDITKPSYFGGLSAQFKTHHFVYTFQALHDLVESDGNEYLIQVSKAFEINDKFTLSPSIGLVYQDNSLVDYYYGVQTNEVAIGRPQHSAQGSLNYNVTLNSSWNITRHIQLLGQLKYEMLGDGVTNSPIVDKDNLYFFTLGAVFRF